MAARRKPIVLVEIDLWDGFQIQTLRLANFGPITRPLETERGHLLGSDSDEFILSEPEYNAALTPDTGSEYEEYRLRTKQR